MDITITLAKCEIESLINLVENAKTTNDYDNEYLSEIIEDLTNANNSTTNRFELPSCIVDVLVELVEAGIGKASNEKDWDEYDNLHDIIESLYSAQEIAEEDY